MRVSLSLPRRDCNLQPWNMCTLHNVVEYLSSVGETLWDVEFYKYWVWCIYTK